MPDAGLSVVGNNGMPVDSVYQLADNGLFLPPMAISMDTIAKANASPYPEFAKEVVSTLSVPWLTNFVKQHYKPPSFQVKPLRLLDIVPNIGTRLDLTCPAGCSSISTFWHLTTVQHGIIHLNDDHHWPREKIANWLDTLPIDLTIKKVA